MNIREQLKKLQRKREQDLMANRTGNSIFTSYYSRANDPYTH